MIEFKPNKGINRKAAWNKWNWNGLMNTSNEFNYKTFKGTDATLLLNQYPVSLGAFFMRMLWIQLSETSRDWLDILDFVRI